MLSITLLYLIILIISIIAHEVAHGYAANSLGDPTARLEGRLTLNPLPHIDPVGSVIVPALLVFTQSPIFFGWAKPVPYNPYNLRNQRWGEGFVAIAGSATNLALALVFGLIARFATLPEQALFIVTTIAFVNLFLGLFNLIPFPPLDGFTVLRSLAPWRFAQRLTDLEYQVQNAGVGYLILFLLAFSYLLSRPFFTFVEWIFTLLIGA
jgi:Zn-dependent protease